MLLGAEEMYCKLASWGAKAVLLFFKRKKTLTCVTARYELVGLVKKESDYYPVGCCEI